MTEHFFLAKIMSMIANKLSFPLRFIAFFFFLASYDSFAQLCYCPPPGTCNTCSGGFSRFTMKYNGLLRVYVTATDQVGSIYEGWVSPGESFMFSGSIPNQKFQGSSVSVYVGGILNAIFGVNCGDEYPGSSSGFFELTNIISLNGGVVCCTTGNTDTAKPIILGCPSNKTGTLPASSCTVQVNWVEPTATDVCTVWWTKSHTPNSSFPVGQTTVTYTAADTYGNQSTCSFNVTVNDVTPPELTGCPTTVIRTADASCKAKGNWIPPTATDNNCISPIEVKSDRSPDDTFPIGTTQVKYEAKDVNGNKSTCIFNVIVEDKTPPVFVYCTEIITATVTTSCLAKIQLPKLEATDNCSDAKVTSSHPDEVELPLGETTVTYTAVDDAANSATCSVKVVVSNELNPEIDGCPATITEGATEAEKDSVDVTWDEPVATVACGEVTLEKSHEPGSKFPVGKTPVTYTFSDQSGKSSTCTFDVVVLKADVLFEVSKVVTPDGDGINDVWTLANIEDFQSNTVVIVDRWGNKIFQATGYDNVRTVWNGTNKNGTIVPTGTYFYTVEVRNQGKVMLKKGFIELIQ
jgi:large repetitive protein